MLPSWQGGKHQVEFDEEETQKLTYAQLLSAIDKVIARTRSVAASESLFLATGELHETASMGSSTYPDFTKLEPWELQDTIDVRNQYPQQEPPNGQQTLVQDLISSLSRHSHPVVLLVWDGSKPPTMEQLCRLRDGPPFDLDESSDGHQTVDGEPDEAVIDNVEEQDICQGKPFKLGDFVLDPEDRGPIELRARLKNNWENDELYRKSLVAIGEVGGPSTIGEALILNEIDQQGDRTRVSHGTQSSVNRRARAHIRCFSEMLKVYAEDATCEFPISPDSSRSSTDSLCKLISPNRHHTPAKAGSGDVPGSKRISLDDGLLQMRSPGVDYDAAFIDDLTQVSHSLAPEPTSRGASSLFVSAQRTEFAGQFRTQKPAPSIDNVLKTKLSPPNLNLSNSSPLTTENRGNALSRAFEMASSMEKNSCGGSVTNHHQHDSRTLSVMEVIQDSWPPHSTQPHFVPKFSSPVLSSSPRTPKTQRHNSFARSAASTPSFDFLGSPGNSGMQSVPTSRERTSSIASAEAPSLVSSTSTARSLTASVRKFITAAVRPDRRPTTYDGHARFVSTIN